MGEGCRAFASILGDLLEQSSYCRQTAIIAKVVSLTTLFIFVYSDFTPYAHTNVHSLGKSTLALREIEHFYAWWNVK